MPDDRQDRDKPALAVTFEVTIDNLRGLHARAAAKIVNLTQRFDAIVLLSHKNKEVEANSIIELLLLGARQGATLKVHCYGPESQSAADAIKDLITGKFGESL